MKGSMRAAAAIGIGYVLGRHKKFRTAAMMAAGMTVGGTTVGSIVLKRGMKVLGSTDAIQKVSPQLGDLVDVVRGDLVSAGKAAATAAVSNRVDALTDSLHERAEQVRNPAAAAAEGTEEAAEAGRSAARTGRRAATGGARRAGGAARRVTGRGAEAEPDEADEGDEGDEGEDGYEPEEDEYQDEYEDDNRADEADEAEEADEAPARRAPARRRSPVTRARR